ncbi:hypothetical protein PMAYCL1PPCAC_13561, partial [Pristionchus mayeri]
MDLVLTMSYVFNTMQPHTAMDSYGNVLRQKTVGAIGTLVCGSEPLAGIPIALVATGYTTPDAVFATDTTDSNGNFNVFGPAWAGSGFEAVIRFTHSCKGGVIRDSRNCLLAMSWPIPPEYLSRSMNIRRYFTYR